MFLKNLAYIKHIKIAINYLMKLELAKENNLSTITKKCFVEVVAIQKSLLLFKTNNN